MGRFTLGLLFGLILGLIFAPIIFPDGIVTAIEHWAENVRSAMPIH